LGLSSNNTKKTRPYEFTNPTPTDLLSAKNYSHKKVKNFNLSNWRCPACNRSVAEITRWHSTGNWGYFIVEHHDHSSSPRFENVFICDDCNKVDAKIKIKGRKILMRHDWSFSLEEIRRVIVKRPHQRHIIDVKAGIEIALKIINRVA
jgi:hypothetical protein